MSADGRGRRASPPAICVSFPRTPPRSAPSPSRAPHTSARSHTSTLHTPRGGHIHSGAYAFGARASPCGLTRVAPSLQYGVGRRDERAAPAMKKFTFKGVLDGFRSSPQPPVRGQDQEIQETLRSDHFLLKKVSERFSPARFRTERANRERARTQTKQTERRPDPYPRFLRIRFLFFFIASINVAPLFESETLSYYCHRTETLSISDRNKQTSRHRMQQSAPPYFQRDKAARTRGTRAPIFRSAAPKIFAHLADERDAAAIDSRYQRPDSAAMMSPLRSHIFTFRHAEQCPKILPTFSH